MAGNLHSCFAKIKSPPSTPPADLSRPFYVKTYNSLYDDGEEASDSDAPPDFASAFASRRFFFSSPGRSNSIIDSCSASSIASTSSSSSSSNRLPENEGGVAVPTESADPFVDFRRSMQEMVEAREINNVREKWDYLHQLLMCYLSLNPKSTHKYIVGAFADLLVSLIAPPIEKGKYKVGEIKW